MKYLIIILLTITPLVHAVENSIADNIETLCRDRYPTNGNYVLSCMNTQTRAYNNFDSVTTKYWPNMTDESGEFRLLTRSIVNGLELVGTRKIVNWLKVNAGFKRDMGVVLYFNNETHLYPDLTIL